eukprot:2268119-Pyramimonas_sp.AAC.1
MAPASGPRSELWECAWMAPVCQRGGSVVLPAVLESCPPCCRRFLCGGFHVSREDLSWSSARTLSEISP